MKIVLPLYVYPIADLWRPYHNAIQQYPQLNFTIIINPNSGPGNASGPGIDYQNELTYLAAYSNVNTVGYVRTNYGNRNINDVKADVDVYDSWVPGIRPKGIFFDETPPSSYTHMNIISSYARSTNTGQTIIFNPGDPFIDNTYFDIADLICTFEQSYTWYLQHPPPLLGPYASQSVALLHNVTSFSILQDLVTTFGQSKWASVFVTDQPDSLSAYTIIGPDWSNYTFLMNQAHQLYDLPATSSTLAVTPTDATNTQIPPANSSKSLGITLGSVGGVLGVLILGLAVTQFLHRRKKVQIVKRAEAPMLSSRHLVNSIKLTHSTSASPLVDDRWSPEILV